MDDYCIHKQFKQV